MTDHLFCTGVELLVADDESEDLEDRETYKSMHARDERRFKMADKDGDGIATREEFTAFLHPEEFDYMRKVVVQVRGAYGNTLPWQPHSVHVS